MKIWGKVLILLLVALLLQAVFAPVAREAWVNCRMINAKSEEDRNRIYREWRLADPRTAPAQPPTTRPATRPAPP